MKASACQALFAANSEHLTRPRVSHTVGGTNTSGNDRLAGETMKILISGASGLAGKAIVGALCAQGHRVAGLVRPGGPRSEADVAWDPLAATIDVAALEGVEAVVHLSGASIAEGRWTATRKAMLRSSRIDTTRVLVDALTSLQRKPRVLVCASAIGYYGDRGDEILAESSSNGTDFLALLVRDWEAEAVRAEISGIRVVRLRFGVILSAKGGALPLMLLPFKFGLGGRLGSGEQWMSWIALEDVAGIVCAAIANDQFVGALNVVAPNPLRNAEFTRIVANVLHRPAIFAAPAFALRLALGEMADVLLLASQRVTPERLAELGYNFRLQEFEPALRAILQRKQ
jgi:uncharacterized protein